MTTYTADDFCRARFATHPTSGKTLERKLAGDAAPWMGELHEYRNTDAEMARGGWVPVQENPRPLTPDAMAERARRIAAEQKVSNLRAEVNELWPYRKRAEKAEKERDRLATALETTARQRDDADKRNARPLTADDEMVDRFLLAETKLNLPGGPRKRSVARYILTAALTPPPARPEGAEGIERLLTEDLGDFSPPVTPEAIADLLAVRGVRVVTEERQ